MPSEALRLTAQIVMSHASATELKPEELIDEIKQVYSVLASLEGEGVAALETVLEKGEKPGEVKKPPIPLKDIVKAKYVVCLECGKKMRTLKTHLRKAHNLTAKEYFKLYALDKKKYPLVCKEYSEMRRKMAVDKGLGAKGGKRKAAKLA
jgi:predicted transcriptional regulator